MNPIRALLVVGLVAGCGSMEERTIVNAGKESIRLELLERREGYPDYRSTIGPDLGLEPGRPWRIEIDTEFENTLVVSAGDRVVGEIPIDPGGPGEISIDARALGRPDRAPPR